MEELAKVSLDNEMDLILSHKRAMKLAELVGLSLASQTTFATAVSEVARYALEQGDKPQLALGIGKSRSRQTLIATVEDKHLPVTDPLNKGLLYAQRLIEKMEISLSAHGTKISLYCGLPATRKVNQEYITQWRTQFTGAQSLSAYDEIKRKNEQLLELAEGLQASDQHYKQVTNSLPLIIFTANQAGQLLYANAWLSAFTGYSIQAINQAKWANIIHPDDIGPVKQLWAQQAGNKLPFQQECRLLEGASQAYLWHLFSAQPLNDASKQTSVWTGFIVNIHAQKLVEQTLRENEELIQAKASLEQTQQVLESTIGELNRSNTELSQFAYVASHDLQEPLRKIQQFGDLLRTRNLTLLSTDSLTYLERILTSASRMSALIRDILAFSRLSTRREELASVSLSTVVKRTLDNLSLIIEESKAQVRVHALPDVQGEVTQLDQLFQNLLSNALKFRRAGSIPQIQIHSEELLAADLPHFVKPTRSNAVYYKIDVIDNGIGFEEKYLDRIFQVFQRLHNQGDFAGTGIGLATCRKVVANHGGAITATSQPGQGATFSVYLPA